MLPNGALRPPLLVNRVQVLPQHTAQQSNAAAVSGQVGDLERAPPRSAPGHGHTRARPRPKPLPAPPDRPATGPPAQWRARPAGRPARRCGRCWCRCRTPTPARAGPAPAGLAATGCRTRLGPVGAPLTPTAHCAERRPRPQCQAPVARGREAPPWCGPFRCPRPMRSPETAPNAATPPARPTPSGGS
jgi:hypothetical protein